MPGGTRIYPYDQPMVRAVIAAHCFGIIAIILILVWLLNYREGLNLDSPNSYRVFNVHPFLMFSGFIFLAGEGIMAFKVERGKKPAKKFAHAALHFLATILGIVGLHAAFKSHDMQNVGNMHSLHSWLGMATFCLFILQLLFGLFIFLIGAKEMRNMALPWHISGGRAILLMAICTAETGLMQKSMLLGFQHGHETALVNVIGLAILLFGLSVDLSVFLGRFRS